MFAVVSAYAVETACCAGDAGTPGKSKRAVESGNVFPKAAAGLMNAIPPSGGGRAVALS